jgi:hypothetical protein
MILEEFCITHITAQSVNRAVPIILNIDAPRLAYYKLLNTVPGEQAFRTFRAIAGPRNAGFAPLRNRVTVMPN